MIPIVFVQPKFVCKIKKCLEKDNIHSVIIDKCIVKS